MAPTFGTRLVLLAVLVLSLACVASAISATANEPIADNNLGKIARHCATTYCGPGEKDSLRLWMELQPLCSGRSSPVLANFAETYTGIDAGASAGVSLWSPFIVGTACALAALVGMVVGLRSGAAMGLKYSKLQAPLRGQP